MLPNMAVVERRMQSPEGAYSIFEVRCGAVEHMALPRVQHFVDQLVDAVAGPAIIYWLLVGETAADCCRTEWRLPATAGK